jgi:hypothetical protein
MATIGIGLTLLNGAELDLLAREIFMEFDGLGAIETASPGRSRLATGHCDGRKHR